MISLDRIDSVPLLADPFSYQFKAWLGSLVDTLNSIMNQIEDTLVSTMVTSSATQQMQVNTKYIATNASQTIFTLPPIAMGTEPVSEVGSIITVSGFGVGGWKILTNVGQTIAVASVPSIATTSITSAHQYDTITLECIVADTVWTTLSAQTTGFAIV